MSKTVLVVDDEMLIALDIQLQLEELGHNTVLASTVRDALVLVDRNPVDVAIVDWHLRNEISAPLIDLLQRRNIPFVLCSGSGFEELASLFPTSPILTKPFASADLVNVLTKVVDERLVQ